MFLLKLTLHRHVLTGPLDVIDVDWSSLMPKQKLEPRAAGAALLRFTPGAVLLRAGISKRLAGPELLEQVKEVCKSELDDPKGERFHIMELLFKFVSQSFALHSLYFLPSSCFLYFQLVTLHIDNRHYFALRVLLFLGFCLV